MESLLMVSLALCLAKVSAYNTDVYNFPFVAIIQYDVGGSGAGSVFGYGTATILHSQLVVVASENLLQKDIDNPDRFVCQSPGRNNLFIAAGSDILNPTREISPHLQRARIADIYFAKNSSFMEAVDCKGLGDPTCNYNSKDFMQFQSLIVKNPDEISRSVGFVTNPFGELQWDVAIMTLATALVFSPFVLPIPFHSGRPQDGWSANWRLLTSLERNPHGHPPCTVPSWSPTGTNEIIYHKVVYVRMKDCEDAICASYPGACLDYFDIRHHFCFKSLAFADSCFVDQGAPVYCTWSQNNILGILVKTWDCGMQSIPLVFTARHSIEAFAKLASQTEEPKDPTIDDFTEAPKR